MITLFAIPKPFRGHTGVIQRNAIESWTRLRPICQIVLLGNDDGTSETAKEFEAEHIPHVGRNEFGTPLLDSAFAAAEHVATNNLLCYVNADIVFMSDFMTAVTRLAGQLSPFLMIGQRWDVNIAGPLDFDQPDWEDRLRCYVSSHAMVRNSNGSDFFVFTRGLWQVPPPFAVGRFWWEYALVARARALGAAVVDASTSVMAVHQTHDYSHFPEGRADVWGPEARRNYALAGGHERLYAIGDATHILTPMGLSRETPSRLQAKRSYYANRVLAEIGMAHYVAADIKAAWRAWSKAVRQNPSVLTPSLLLLMAKSLLGPRLLSWSRRLRRRHRPQVTTPS